MNKPEDKLWDLLMTDEIRKAAKELTEDQISDLLEDFYRELTK